MKQLPPDLTPNQLKVFETLERIKMAWIALFCALGLFTLGFVCFLYAIFFLNEHTIPKTILGGIDTLLGWILHIVYAHLFPKPKGAR
jgi:hypothetical protein